MTPQLVFLAGPNGAGKTTFYRRFLRHRPLPFLNADVVAGEMGVESFEAARMLDTMRTRMIEAGLGFITETVFSDPHGAKLAMLHAAVDAGFEVSVIYIGIASAALSAMRVSQRVARGGHDVPRDRIAARFTRSLANLKAALPFVPSTELYDNTSPDEPFLPVARFATGVVTWRAKGRLPTWTRGIVPPARAR